LSHFELRNSNQNHSKQTRHCYKQNAEHHLIRAEEHNRHGSAQDVRHEMEHHHRRNTSAAAIIKPGNDDLERERKDEDIEPIHLAI
jgi:hypothetical protein